MRFSIVNYRLSAIRSRVQKRFENLSSGHNKKYAVFFKVAAVHVENLDSSASLQLFIHLLQGPFTEAYCRLFSELTKNNFLHRLIAKFSIV